MFGGTDMRTTIPDRVTNRGDEESLPHAVGHRGTAKTFGGFMSFIRQIEESAATGLLRKIYDSARQRAGGIANIIRIMSLDAAICQASMGFYLAAVRSNQGLDRATRELLATVVSNVNDCYY